MSLDNIQLPAAVIQDLYKDVLIDSSQPKQRQESVSKKSINYLGENGQHIIILVNNPEAAYLKDEELNFLMGILTACKLSMADVAIINLAKAQGLDYTRLTDELKAQQVLLFGVVPSAIDLPLQFPNYQIQQYNSRVYLSSPNLTELAGNKEEKMKLWMALKKVFNI